MNLKININDISETAFLTLKCHAIDALSVHPLLNDQSSIHAFNMLEPYLMDSNAALSKMLIKHKIKKNLVVHTALRARKYDQFISDFINKYPKATIVNIGCGLDNRFERVDNGLISFYDLDLPDIINIKKHLFPKEDRYYQISKSVFELDWIDTIKGEHILLVAEGVFMYCNRDDIQSLFFKLQDKLPNSEIVCEVVNSKWLKGFRKKMIDFKLQKELKLGKGSSFKFGISDSKEIESWNLGLKFLGDWSYFDSDESNSSFLKLFRMKESFRKIQWTVHYKLIKI